MVECVERKSVNSSCTARSPEGWQNPGPETRLVAIPRLHQLRPERDSGFCECKLVSGVFGGHCWYLAGWGDDADSPVAMFQQVEGGESAALLVVEEGSTGRRLVTGRSRRVTSVSEFKEVNRDGHRSTGCGRDGS